MSFESIPPYFNRDSKILILGSFPSVISRQEQFFYANVQNRFWKVLSYIFGGKEPIGTSEKKAFLLKNKIALWDVICSCDINKSSDSSIRNAKISDVGHIIANSEVKRIFLNGKAAEKYYNKYLKDKIDIPAVYLPSTSSANAAKSFEDLCENWKIIK